MNNPTEIDLRWILNVLRYRFWPILICTFAAGMIAFYVTSRLPLTYKSSINLLISPNEASTQNEYSNIVAGERLALTYSQMLKSWSVLEQVVKKLELDETVEELKESISAEPIKDTQLIKLSVTSNSPEQAISIVKAIADEFILEINHQFSERYSGFISEKQQRIEETSELIEETQLRIDELSIHSIESQTKLSRLQNDFNDYRSEYRVLLDEYQTTQLAISRLKENVKIIEEAQVSTNQELFPSVATVTLLIDSTSNATGSNYSSLPYTESIALTYGNIITSRPVLQNVVTRLGLEGQTDELAQRIKVNVIPNTQLVKVSVSDAQASQAELIANTVAEAFIERIQKIEISPYSNHLENLHAQIDQISKLSDQTQSEIESLNESKIQSETELARLQNLQLENRNDLRTLQQDYERLRLTASSAEEMVSIAVPASLPTKPVQNRFLYIILAGFIGAMVSMVTAFVIEQNTDVIRTMHDVRKMNGLTMVGFIGRLPKKGDQLAIRSEANSAPSEAIRTIVTNIRLSSEAETFKSIVITSPSQDEGKSIITANLAVALAETGMDVILIDADLYYPRQHLLFHIDQNKGLSGALQSGSTRGKLKRVTNMERLRIIPSGEPLGQTAGLINSPNLKIILDELKLKTDIILIDCPPILQVAFSKILASEADGVLLVLRIGQTRRTALQDTIMNLEQVQAHLLGVVVNDPADRKNGNYGYKYYRKSPHFDPPWLNTKRIIQKIFSKEQP